MGTSCSKETEAEKEITHKHCIKWIEMILPYFVKSEYCEEKEGAFMDLNTFVLALYVYAIENEIQVPQKITDITLMRDYIHLHFNNSTIKSIYVSGATMYNTLVGVSVVKWPGTHKSFKPCFPSHFIPQNEQLARPPF